MDPQNMTLDEEEIVERQQISNVTPNDVLWYVVPHQCASLNIIVMASLLKLASPDNKIYITRLRNGGPNEYHYVITSVQLESNTILDFEDDNNDNEIIILYDLYYPVMSYFGFHYRDDTKSLTSQSVESSTSVADYLAKHIT